MKFLDSERLTLENFLPGLDKKLSDFPFPILEERNGEGINLFKASGGPALLIPEIYAGMGITPVEGIQILRAIGSRSPSLAIAVTMHMFSVATLVEMCENSDGLEGLFLEGIARGNLLLASGFAEGRKDGQILSPVMTARRSGKGYLISGSKKPCSLAHSMDFLTASVSINDTIDKEKDGTTGVALIPGNAKGLERSQFWSNWVLAGAESDELILNEVFIEDKLMYPLSKFGRLESTQESGFIWFELLITSAYLGIASGLVEKAIIRDKGSPSDRLQLGVEMEGAMASLEGIARKMMTGERGSDLLGRMLLVRYSVQNAISRAINLAMELLGGLEFISSSEVSYLLASAKALVFHPPSRTYITPELNRFLRGESLIIK